MTNSSKGEFKSTGLFGFKNKDTFVLGKVPSEVKKEQLFVSSDQYFFDIEELYNLFESNNGIFKNPYTDKLFSSKDLMTLCQRDSRINQLYNATYNKRLLENVKLISDKTIEWLQISENKTSFMVRDQKDALQFNHLSVEEKSQALYDFSEYFFNLDEQERVALDSVDLSSSTGGVFKNVTHFLQQFSSGQENCLNGAGGFFEEIRSKIITAKEEAEKNAEQENTSGPEILF